MVWDFVKFLFETAIPGQSFFDYLSRASVITLLIVIVYGGYKRWWVFGWVLSDSEKRYDALKNECELLREEKDAWRATALRSANVATQAFEEIRNRPGSKKGF